MRTHLHQTLLRLAGWLSDDLLADARAGLADDRCGEVARMLTFAGQRTVLPLTAGDIDVLAGLLAADGAPPDVLDTIELTMPEAPPTWQFAETLPDEAHGRDGEPLIAALAGAELVAAIAAEPAVRGLWRAWRLPDDGSPSPRPCAVYVVETDEPDLAALTGRLQPRLAAAGEAPPRIEVVAVGDEPPTYQRAAMASGSLLWSRAVAPDLARVFDSVDPSTGPGFAPDHPRMIDRRERDRILRYLDGGTPLLATTGTFDDVVDAARGAVVPMSFRTDGTWIWTDMVAYYLREHQLAPEPRLLRHISSASGPPPAIDAATRHRAMRVLTAPLDAEGA